jgi:methanogenic corrinoid protein MtbC1
MLGLALRARGWRVAYLGADTPGESLVEGTERLEPSLVVVSAVRRGRFGSAQAQLAAVAKRSPLAIAGPGATRSLADSVGAQLIEGGPVDAAERLASQAAA